MYARLNHVGVTLSYTGTLNAVGAISKLHQVPIRRWILEDTPFKFVGDNVDKKRGVRDLRSDHHGEMMHMFSVLAVRSRVSSSGLSKLSRIDDLNLLQPSFFMPSKVDIAHIQRNLVILVSRILCKYIKALAPLSNIPPEHILHKYSKQMAQKSEAHVIDVLMKNEAKGADMLDIMESLQSYLKVGAEFPESLKVLSGGDQLTCERETGAQRHVMDGDTPHDRLQLLEPQCEDWHTLMCFLGVSDKCKLTCMVSNDIDN